VTQDALAQVHARVWIASGPTTRGHVVRVVATVQRSLEHASTTTALTSCNLYDRPLGTVRTLPHATLSARRGAAAVMGIGVQPASTQVTLSLVMSTWTNSAGRARS
jgi:hypothetical protein